MDVIVIETQAFYKLVEEVVKRLEADRSRQIANNAATAGNEWISLKEAKQLLPYTSKTKWQQLRDGGEIKFSQFGRKILYSRTSIQDFIKRHKVK